jgi:RNA recognition motif-containing protein
MSIEKDPSLSPRQSRLTIYVANLAPTVTPDDLRGAFVPYGSVVSVTLAPERQVGKRPPFQHGYVEMAQKVDGLTAMQALDGAVLHHLPICLIEALPITHMKGHGQDNNL